MLGVTTLMMALFLGYHLLLLRAGMTTSETYKWRDFRLRLQEQADELAPGCGAFRRVQQYPTLGPGPAVPLKQFVTWHCIIIETSSS